MFTAVGGNDSDDEEEVDSNNDGGSLQSERTDKDDDGFEGEPQTLSRQTELTRKLRIRAPKAQCWQESIQIFALAPWRKRL